LLACLLACYAFLCAEETCHRPPCPMEQCVCDAGNNATVCHVTRNGKRVAVGHCNANVILSLVRRLSCRGNDWSTDLHVISVRIFFYNLFVNFYLGLLILNITDYSEIVFLHKSFISFPWKMVGGRKFSSLDLNSVHRNLLESPAFL
jgi:hypothetical protein